MTLRPSRTPRRSVIDPDWSDPLSLKIDRLDFRIEAVSSDTPSASAAGGHLVYWDIFYHDLGTNKNNLIGSWIGRQGTWATKRGAHIGSARGIRFSSPIATRKFQNNLYQTVKRSTMAR